MQVENHKEEAPFAHYAELFRDLNPAAVTARLSDVRWDGKTVKVRCTPAQQVIFYSNVVYTSPRVSKGFGLTETEYTPLDWETFIRVEVIDANGKMAWSSPIDLWK